MVSAGGCVAYPTFCTFYHLPEVSYPSFLSVCLPTRLTSLTIYIVYRASQPG